MDNSNNLIEIYYNKWTNSSFKINTNYYWYNTFNGTESDFQDQSDIHTLINWRNYTNDWDSFTKIYSNVNFIDGSYMSITDSNGTKTAPINFDISKITDKAPVFEDTPVQGGVNDHIKLISNTLNFYLIVIFLVILQMMKCIYIYVFVSAILFFWYYICI